MDVGVGVDVAETSAAGSGSRECQTTTDALCLYFVSTKVYHTILSIPLSILEQPGALDYNNPYHIRLT